MARAAEEKSGQGPRKIHASLGVGAGDIGTLLATITLRMIILWRVNDPQPRLPRERGHDAVAVPERPDLVGLPDAEVWRAAGADGRALVTENVRDFVPLARAAEAVGEAHGGLVLTSPRTFPCSTRAIAVLVDALDQLATRHAADAFADRVACLEPASAPDERGLG